MAVWWWGGGPGVVWSGCLGAGVLCACAGSGEGRAGVRRFVGVVVACVSTRLSLCQGLACAKCLHSQYIPTSPHHHLPTSPPHLPLAPPLRTSPAPAPLPSPHHTSTPPLTPPVYFATLLCTNPCNPLPATPHPLTGPAAGGALAAHLHRLQVRRPPAYRDRGGHRRRAVCVGAEGRGGLRGGGGRGGKGRGGGQRGERQRGRARVGEGRR